jgi:predicted dehydrogenase
MNSVTAPVSRRRFLQQAGAAMALTRLTPGYAAGSDRLRVGLVGCGSRGTGAAMNCVTAAPGVEIVALGDVFQDRVEACLKRLTTVGEKDWSSSQPWTRVDAVKVTRETCFVGLEAYERVIASGVDLVILATPPAFRPQHLRAAVEAGKHTFIEKPVAVDPVGARSIIASGEIAKAKGLAIVAGTQRRHQPRYAEMMARVHAGAIGEITSGEAFWLGPCVRKWGYAAPRQPEWTDLEWQLRNWYFFTWLSGDHIVDQHLHNLDVINWAMGSPPADCIGMGGRQWRTEPEYGNVWDHFAVRYRYPNGATVQSMCRQNDGTYELITEAIQGRKGRATPGRIDGAESWRFSGDDGSAYEHEHAAWVRSIRKGTPLNEAQRVAESTLTAIMGRMSAYTGKVVQWDWVRNRSTLDLTPAAPLHFGPLPVPPVAVPGQTPLV